MGRSFDVLKTESAQTERQGDVSDGLSGDLEIKITSLDCLPVDPINADISQMAGLDVWVGLYHTFVSSGLDIQAGDRFTILPSTSYKVRSVASWYWRPEEEDTLLITLEDVK